MKCRLHFHEQFFFQKSIGKFMGAEITIGYFLTVLYTNAHILYAFSPRLQSFYYFNLEKSNKRSNSKYFFIVFIAVNFIYPSLEREKSYPDH